MASILDTAAHVPLMPPRYRELAVVRLVHDHAIDGRSLPAGTVGTIVYAYADGVGYEVEFSDPFHAVVTLETADIAA